MTKTEKPKISSLFFKNSSAKAKLSAFVLLLIMVALFCLFLYYRVPIKGYAKNAVENFGYPALFFFCWAADVIIQPIPADVIVFGTAFGEANMWLTAFVAGLSSALGGLTGYFIGKIFGPWRFRRLFGSKLLRKGRDLFRDHGSLAIFIAGVSPVPYSAVCWIGGIYNMALIKVVAASWISRTLRYILVAWLGNLLT
ncbi:MAG: DedA family protein [Erysipelotrichia bacterium]|nr:VTT domain-containing protein [Candidatus Riflebacteria bacterium]NCB39139.1 DedA family protein [Erysipelotrichia bacterium]